MHFERPKAKSFKEFAGEYIMIVVSILTALALEHAAQSYHRWHVVQEAVHSLNMEIAANIAETHKVIEHNTIQVDKLAHLKQVVSADIKAGTSDHDTLRHMMKEAGNDFGLNIRSPSLQREAWDVAIANQALSYMDPDKLQRYAKLYAVMRDMQNALSGASNAFINLPQYMDTVSDIEIDKVTAHDMYRTLGQLSAAYRSSIGNLKSLEQQLREEGQRATGAASH